MIPVLSREQIRAFDQRAISRGVPSLLLMENAGRNATDVLEREMLGGAAAGKRVAVVCGTGNNGGDGFVIARHLRVRGADVSVVLVGDEAKLSVDAKANAAAWRAVGGTLSAEVDASAEVVVDALFGTGLDRPVEGPARELVGRLAKMRVFAVDIPSGLDAQTGAVLGVAVRAEHTVTFAHHKLGLLTPNGAAHAGRVHLVDIGVPSDLDGDLGGRAAAELLEARDVASFVAVRAPDAHKYRAGHVGVLGGSPGKTGAALLVARGALRAGAGAVTVATWHDALPSLQARVLEVMTVSLDALEKPLIEVAASFAHAKRAVVAGPGFGTDERAATAIRALLVGYDGNVVLDADGLTLYAGKLSELGASKPKLVLTPHSGEAARLLETTSEVIEADRFASARRLAAKSKAVVVLKGAHTLIATPDGRVVISAAADSVLATAGSGDVLAGIIGACACGIAPFEAACAGVYLHAGAGEVWRARGDRRRGMLASEIADRVPDVLASLGR